MQNRRSFEFGEFRPPQMSTKFIRWVIIGVAVLVAFITSLFTIGPEEAGVILTFGKYSRTVTSGLNLKLPFGIEAVYKVPVERQLKEEFGFRTIKAGIRSEYSSESFQEESLMLTGDLNTAEVEWIVQYRVKDPYKFLFRVRNTIQTFRDMNEAVMREVIGDRTVDEVLTIGRQEISDSVTLKLQALCDQYETGINVAQVVLQDVTPPDPVKPAFNEVNEAEQEREKLINQARSEYNQVIPKARGDAQKVIEEAKGYALERINQARGDSARFMAVYKEYQRAPEVTRQRLYLETMNQIMPKVGRKLIADEKTTGILPLFQFEEAKKNE